MLGIPVDIVESTLFKIGCKSNTSLDSVDKINSSLKNIIFYRFTKPFTGDGSPELTEDMKAFKVLNHTLQISHYFTFARFFCPPVPLSFGLFVRVLNVNQITHQITSLVIIVGRKLGTFQERNRCGHCRSYFNTEIASHSDCLRRHSFGFIAMQ